MISISHPQTHYSRKLAEALAEINLLNKFYTATFFEPEKFKLLPPSIRKKLSKGYNPNIPNFSVSNFWLFELIWRSAYPLITHSFYYKLNFFNLWGFDSVIASKIKKDKSKIFIGFENSSFNTFKRAKTMGKKIVLEAPSTHYKHQLKYYHPKFSNSFLNKIIYRKEKEIELADYIITTSSFPAETYRENCPDKRIIPILLGVDTSKFQYIAKNNADNYFRYLFAGNITYAKGIDLLVKAFSKINNPRMKIILAGAAGDAINLCSKDNRINYLGMLSHNELINLYHKCDVLVLPSRLDGAAAVVFEAMATGTPTIVSTHTGAKDLITNGVNGWIFPDGNVDELKNTMLNIYENRDKLNVYGKAAAETVKEFTWDRYKKNIQEFYSNLLSEIN